MLNFKNKLPSVLCVISLVYVFVFHISLHTSSDAPNNIQLLQDWKQPNLASEGFLEPVNNRKTSFNFSQIERILWQFTIAQSGDVEFSVDSAKQLELACSYIQESISIEDMQRLQFLIKKSIPASAGKNMAQVLSNYCQYLIEERKLLTSLNIQANDSLIQLLTQFPVKLIQLQEEIFGDELSTVLFAMKNRTVLYLNQRRLINARTDITTIEKNKQLELLARAYKASLGEK